MYFREKERKQSTRITEISLTNHIKKVYERILERKARDHRKKIRTLWIHAKLEHFRCCICLENSIKKKSWQLNRLACITFIDKQKVYDYQKENCGNVWK